MCVGLNQSEIQLNSSAKQIVNLTWVTVLVAKLPLDVSQTHSPPPKLWDFEILSVLLSGTKVENPSRPPPPPPQKPIAKTTVGLTGSLEILHNLGCQFKKCRQMKIKLFFYFFSSLKDILQYVKASLDSKGLRLSMKLDKNSSRQLSIWVTVWWHRYYFLEE